MKIRAPSSLRKCAYCNKQNGCGLVYISGERNVTGAQGGQSVKMGPVEFWVGGAAGGDDGYSR